MLAICLCYRQKMQSKLLFNLIIICLLAIGAWGLWQTLPSTNLANKTLTDSHNSKKSEATSTVKQNITPSNNESTFTEIKLLINTENISKAIAEINQHYSNLSGEELESLKLDLIDFAFTQNTSVRKTTSGT